VAAPSPVAVGARVTVFVVAPSVSATDPVVVHRDEWIAVLDKPAECRRKARSATAPARSMPRVAPPRPGARMLHRLDKEASGLVLFALETRAQAPLQRALLAGEIDRRYVALVDGELHGDGSIRLRIARHPAIDVCARRCRRTRRQANRRAAAIGRWRVPPGTAALSAVELTLETGRTHQLRVHSRRAAIHRRCTAYAARRSSACACTRTR